MGCKKAQGFLEQNDLQVQSVTDASKERKGRAEVIALAKTVSKIVVGRGKKVVNIDMQKDAPDDDTLAAVLDDRHLALWMDGSPGERLAMADELCGHVLAGRINGEPKQQFALADAADAPRALESRQTTGATVLVP